jgi:hypothetical protein
MEQECRKMQVPASQAFNTLGARMFGMNVAARLASISSAFLFPKAHLARGKLNFRPTSIDWPHRVLHHALIPMFQFREHTPRN